MTASTINFLATKSSEQTGVTPFTFVQVTFQTEVFDNGGFFASNAWTPPAGYVRLYGGLFMEGAFNNAEPCVLAIYKSCDTLQWSGYGLDGSFNVAGPLNIVVDDISSGTAPYTMRGYYNGSSASFSSSASTWFGGYWVGST